MLSISDYHVLIFEDIDLSEVSIQKNSELSRQDKKDIDRLIHEFDQAEGEHDQEYLNMFTNKLSSNNIEYNLQDWKNKNITLYTLKKKDRIIGFCTVIPNYKVFKDSVYIQYLIISKKERSSGYGRYLINYVIDDIKKNYPGKKIVINVFDRNPVAKKLYTSLGFRPGTITMIKS